MSDGDARTRGRTTVLFVDAVRPDPGVIREAARCLNRGGLVAFPTETVYGLGADASSGPAVARVFAAKGRPSDNPLIVHVASPDEVRPLVREVTDQAASLMRTFWPGPLSLVFRRTGAVAAEVSCGLDTVAIRMPAHPVALELIRFAGVPVAAPSANASGRPSPTRAADVLSDLDGLIDYILDAGPCSVGLESTVLDLTGPAPVVLRPGGVTVEQLRRALGEVRVLDADVPPVLGRPLEPDEAARSPGLRHRHYSPRTRLVLVLPPAAGEVAPAVARVVRDEMAAGRKVAVACTDETASELPRYLPRLATWAAAAEGGPVPPDAGAVPVVVAWGSRHRADEIAARLFAALRDLDGLGADVIVAEGLRPDGIGVAVNDRLARAAGAALVAGPAGPPVPAESPGLILLVCSGNTCRSPMAAALLTDVLRRRGQAGAYRVGSAGIAAVTGDPATPDAVRVMTEHNLDLGLHRARQVTPDLLAEARLVLTMTGGYRKTLLGLAPGVAARIFTLKGYAGLAPSGSSPDASVGPEDISDPYHWGLEAYREAAAEIGRAVERVVERLIDGAAASGGPAEDSGASKEGTDT